MDVTLPDLIGLVCEEIPKDWWNVRESMPIAAVFGMSPDQGPMLQTLFLNSQPHWELLREQFPSLRKVHGVGRYAMDEADFAKMRLVFGGEW